MRARALPGVAGRYFAVIGATVKQESLASAGCPLWFGRPKPELAASFWERSGACAAVINAADRGRI